MPTRVLILAAILVLTVVSPVITVKIVQFLNRKPASQTQSQFGETITVLNDIMTNDVIVSHVDSQNVTTQTSDIPLICEGSQISLVVPAPTLTLPTTTNTTMVVRPQMNSIGSSTPPVVAPFVPPPRHKVAPTYSPTRLARSYRVREVLAQARLKFPYTPYTQLNKVIVHRYVVSKLRELHVRNIDLERIAGVITTLTFVPSECKIEEAYVERSVLTSVQIERLQDAHGKPSLYTRALRWLGYRPSLSLTPH